MNNKCEYAEILCQNDCGAKFQKRFLQKHLDKDCPKKIIACPYCDDRHLREDKKVMTATAWAMSLVTGACVVKIRPWGK